MQVGESYTEECSIFTCKKSKKKAKFVKSFNDTHCCKHKGNVYKVIRYFCLCIEHDYWWYLILGWRLLQHHFSEYQLLRVSVEVRPWLEHCYPLSAPNNIPCSFQLQQAGGRGGGCSPPPLLRLPPPRPPRPPRVLRWVLQQNEAGQVQSRVVPQID